MGKKKPPLDVKASKLAIKQRAHLARFSRDKDSIIIKPKIDRNRQDARAVVSEGSEQHFNKQKQTEEIDGLIALKNANLRSFLVRCVTLIYIGFLVFSLYEFHMTGNIWWIVSDLPASTYFWKLVEHIVLQKQARNQ